MMLDVCWQAPSTFTCNMETWKHVCRWVILIHSQWWEYTQEEEGLLSCLKVNDWEKLEHILVLCLLLVPCFPYFVSSFTHTHFNFVIQLSQCCNLWENKPVKKTSLSAFIHSFIFICFLRTSILSWYEENLKKYSNIFTTTVLTYWFFWFYVFKKVLFKPKKNKNNLEFPNFYRKRHQSMVHPLRILNVSTFHPILKCVCCEFQESHIAFATVSEVKLDSYHYNPIWRELSRCCG